MRTLFVPTIGTELILAQDWTFKIVNEYRNESLCAFLGILKLNDAGVPGRFPLGANPKERYEPADTGDTCTIPKGSKLKVDRIYIRKGGVDMKNFDSVTFLWIGAKTKPRVEKRVAYEISIVASTHTRKEIPYDQKVPARGVRFFAKLDDVNRMKIR